MFTGFIIEKGKVKSATTSKLIIAASKVLKETGLGGSIAINGVCTTINDLTDSSFTVDIMPETKRRTNLGLLHAGDEVNLERPLTLGSPLECHLVQGHIDATGRVVSVARDGDSIIIRIEAPADVMRFIVEKGFIAIDGVSLTVASRDSKSFETAIVRYTQENTTLGKQKVGDRVNLEVDIIAKYVAQFTGKRSNEITLDFLKEHGFMVE